MPSIKWTMMIDVPPGGGRRASPNDSSRTGKEVNHMWMIIAWAGAFLFLCIYLFGTDRKGGPF